MNFVILITIFLLAVLWGAIFGVQSRQEIKEGLKSLRVTVVEKTGEVVFDNFADPKTLDNHLNRPEIAEAIKDGTGQSERYSDTLDEKTYYFAKEIGDEKILRLAMTTDSIYILIYRYLPLIIICLFLVLGIAVITARRMTKRIVAPINDIDLSKGKIDTYDELSPLVRKISEQKEQIGSQIGEIQARADTLKTIAENMQEGLVLLDRKGDIVLENGSAAKLFKEDASAALGKEFIFICREIDLVKNVKLCLSGQRRETKIERDGRIFKVFLNPVIENGELDGAAIFFFEETEKNRLEKQRREFSANVSHELKTPLATISGLSEIIETGMAKEEDIKGFATKIKTQSERLINIIEDIIKLSEFDEGKEAEAEESFELFALAEEVREHLRELAAEKDVAVSVSGERFKIQSVRRMMDELIFNLTENAIKYNNKNGKVEIRLSKSEKGYCIAVSDNGIGIPEKYHDRVFERFYRIDKSRSQKTGGTGLGLSIVKHITEFFGGKIEMESAENSGTTIRCIFELP